MQHGQRGCFGEGGDVAEIGRVEFVAQQGQRVRGAQQVVEQCLQGGGNGVCTGTDGDDDGGEDFGRGHAVWVGAVLVEPLLDHVFADVVVGGAVLDGGGAGVEDVHGGL